MATFTKLGSGSWRVQVRRKTAVRGHHLSTTVHDAEEWARDVERSIDRGPVCTENLNTGVVVVKSAQDGA